MDNDRIVVNVDSIEHFGHFGVVRDWTILLKSGIEIELSADIVRTIVEHENKEVNE